jgi:hypothetical protein
MPPQGCVELLTHLLMQDSVDSLKGMVHPHPSPSLTPSSRSAGRAFFRSTLDFSRLTSHQLAQFKAATAAEVSPPPLGLISSLQVADLKATSAKVGPLRVMDSPPFILDGRYDGGTIFRSGKGDLPRS